MLGAVEEADEGAQASLIAHLLDLGLNPAKVRQDDAYA